MNKFVKEVVSLSSNANDNLIALLFFAFDFCGEIMLLVLFLF